MSESIKVHCSHSELVDILKLVEHPNNPNKHDERQVNLLARIINAQGWRNPITVSKRSGYIVAGHGRLAAAKVLNQEKVPVDYQDFANEADEKAHLLADNRVAELAELDFQDVGNILKELKEANLDLELSGFLDHEIDPLIISELEQPSIDNTDGEKDNSKSVKFTKLQWDIITKSIGESDNYAQSITNICQLRTR
jgi:ParB-like chromosome segregation protein Spo0J